MWADVKYDEFGNVLKVHDKSWEVQSSPSVRERRRIQQFNEWPLSARVTKEKEQMAANKRNRLQEQNTERDHSNQWSFDQEAAGSEGQHWQALPDKYKEHSVDIDDSDLSIKTVKVRDEDFDDPEATKKKLILLSAKSMSFDESKWSVSSHS